MTLTSTIQQRGQPDKVSVIQVIEVVIARGKGTDDDPVRIVHLYYSMDGKILADDDCEYDSKENQNAR